MFIFVLVLFYLFRTEARFIVSVVMPLYNTARYLNDSLNSLLNQSIGFYNNIQIILVNDGSTDNTESICLDYKQRFPNNIIYIKQENAGTSVARNMGMPYATGKYINFLDPDDKWEKDAFHYLLQFCDNHPDIDIVAGRMQYFEGSTKFDQLDYKFNKTRVVDLFKDYDHIHLSVTSTFFRRDTVLKYRFLPGLSYGEDTRLINEMFITNPRFGVVREALHMYRVRVDGSSAVQTAKS